MKEIRSMPLEIKVEGDTAPKLSGYAARYNSLSEPLTLPSPRSGVFYERIAPGAFKSALARNPDVRCLVNHDPNQLLGRSSAGTLKLVEDENGLRMECVPPDTTIGRDTLASVKRGDMREQSFAFHVAPGGERWDTEKRDGKTIAVRTLTDLELEDVSIVTYPVYQATNVEVRCKLEPESTCDNSAEVMEKTLKIYRKSGTA